MPRLKRIHVDQMAIRANIKCEFDPTKLVPPVSVKVGGKTHKAFTVEIEGPSKVVYDGSRLSCGARLWVETRADVVLDGKVIR